MCVFTIESQRFIINHMKLLNDAQLFVLLLYRVEITASLFALLQDASTKPVIMKKVLFSSLLLVLVLNMASAQYGRDRTGYDGDYFSLEGALELFEASQTIRDFERKLNTQDRWVNNLDLDFDGQTDYIRVEHRRQRDFHAIILQAIVGPYDVQDIAVIEIEQTGRQEAVLQIIGDEDMYGQEVYVEPLMGYANSRRGYHSNYGEFVNVFYWPVVQYILGPRYTNVYVSPYRWRNYPIWWNTWRPVTWTAFRPRIVVYQRNFRIVNRHRLVNVRRFYRPNRSYCYDIVVRSNRTRVRNGRQPIYRPRPNNRNRFNNSRVGAGSVDNRNRAGIAGRQSNQARRQDTGIKRDNRGNSNARVNPQSRSQNARRSTNPRISPGDRSTSRTQSRNFERQGSSRPSSTRERQTSERIGPRPSAERNTSRSDQSRARTQSRNFERQGSSRPSYSRERTASNREGSRPSVERSPRRSNPAEARTQSRRPANRQLSPAQSPRTRSSSGTRQQVERRSTPTRKPAVSRSNTQRPKASPARTPTRAKSSSRSRTSNRGTSTRRPTSSRKKNQ